jgi:hypothetical protein
MCPPTRPTIRRTPTTVTKGAWVIPLGILGVAMIAGGAAAADVWFSIATSDSNLDALRLPLLLAVLTTYAPWQIGRAVNAARGLLAVAHAEDSFNGEVGDTDIQGNATAPYGPSISPWQILRSTAVSIGAIDASESASDYAAEDTTSVLGLVKWARVAAQLWKSNEDQGFSGADLFKVWNGGPGAVSSGVSDTYAQNAQGFETQQGWA